MTMSVAFSPNVKCHAFLIMFTNIWKWKVRNVSNSFQFPHDSIEWEMRKCHLLIFPFLKFQPGSIDKFSLSQADYIKTPSGNFFVKSTARKGEIIISKIGPHLRKHAVSEWFLTTALRKVGLVSIKFFFGSKESAQLSTQPLFLPSCHFLTRKMNVPHLT